MNIGLPRRGGQSSWKCSGHEQRRLCCASRDPPADFCVINILLPASVGAVRFCRVDARTLPVFDELEFHVSDHTEDGDDHSTHAADRRDVGLKNAE